MSQISCTFFLCKYIIEDNDCTCDRPRSERWPASVKLVEDMHNTIMKLMRMSLGSASCIFHMKSPIPQIICYTIHMFPYRFQRVEIEKKQNRWAKFRPVLLKEWSQKYNMMDIIGLIMAAYIYIFKGTLKLA